MSCRLTDNGPRALLHRASAFVAGRGICHKAGVSLLPASKIFALPGRAETFRVLETLATGTAGGMLFLWASLPGGLISGAMIAVGGAALAGRQLALPPVLHPWARAEGLLLLDDLLLANGAESDTAVSPIHLISPDPQTKYRLTTAVPAAAQKLPVEAVAAAHMQTITLWLDDAPLATLTNPPYRVWWPLTARS